MKSALKFIIVSFFISTMFLSCDDDNITPDKNVRDTFESMYPNATRIEWEIEYGYYVVDFRQGGHEKEAWFDTSGAWLMTETDLGRTAPEIIAAALSNTEYASWRIDDVDYIEQKDKDPFYIVEVEKGSAERDLYFSEAGELLKEQHGSGDYRPTPY